MPSFKTAVMGIIDKEAAPTQALAVQLHSAMASLIASHAASAVAKRKAARGADKERVSSYEILRALDHGLVLSGGDGLKTFMPLPAASRRLQAGEVRYMSEVGKWGSFDIPVGAPWKRSIVKDVTTGAKR